MGSRKGGWWAARIRSAERNRTTSRDFVFPHPCARCRRIAVPDELRIEDAVYVCRDGFGCASDSS